LILIPYPANLGAQAISFETLARCSKLGEPAATVSTIARLQTIGAETLEFQAILRKVMTHRTVGRLCAPC